MTCDTSGIEASDLTAGSQPSSRSSSSLERLETR
jgi:hypothetical protein